MNLKDIIEKIAREESESKQGQFIAPVVSGGLVRLSVCGVINNYRLADRNYQGWAILEIINDKRVRVVKDAPISLRRQYSDVLKTARFCLVDEIDGIWYGLQTTPGQGGLQTEGPIPINLLERPQQFSSIVAGFDGDNFWYLNQDRRSPALANDLRTALGYDVPEEKLKIRGLLQAERTAYKMALLAKRPLSVFDPGSGLTEKQRMELALNRAGVRLSSFWADSSDRATVTFNLNGTNRTVQVNRSNLSVISSGICLSNRDRDFDLTTIVSVFNERDGK